MLFNALAALTAASKPPRPSGRAGLMLFNAVVGKPEFRKHAPLLVRQPYNVGVLSMLIIIVSGCSSVWYWGAGLSGINDL